MRVFWLEQMPKGVKVRLDHGVRSIRLCRGWDPGVLLRRWGGFFVLVVSGLPFHV